MTAAHRTLPFGTLMKVVIIAASWCGSMIAGHSWPEDPLI
jgi:hypothetical protein